MKIIQSNNSHYFVGFSIEDKRNLLRLNFSNTRKIHIFMTNPKSVNKCALHCIVSYAEYMYQKTRHKMKITIHPMDSFGSKQNEEYIKRILGWPEYIEDNHCVQIDPALEYMKYINCHNDMRVRAIHTNKIQIDMGKAFHSLSIRNEDIEKTIVFWR